MIKKTSKHFIFSIAALSLCFAVLAQTQTARYISMHPTTNAFYEYLPSGYGAGNSNYPLIIFIHGAGELGDGSASQLPWVLRNGIPKLINQGNFPESFTVNNSTYKFIVISPQFNSYSTPAVSVNAVIDYAIAHYRVDLNRIYVTGLSMGGGFTWLVASYTVSSGQRLAAIVPMCGASGYDANQAHRIGQANLPVWAFHNSGDDVISVNNTNSWVAGINSTVPAPNPLAKKTIFNATGHDCWTQASNPSYRENNKNIYEWMLSYQRSMTVLPVSLVDYRAVKSGPLQATITWSCSNEINNGHFTLERSSNGINFSNLLTINPNSIHSYTAIDNHPLVGPNYYRLSQTDADGAITYFPTLKLNFEAGQKNVFVLSPNPAANDMNIRLEENEEGNLSVSVIALNGTIVKHWSFQKTGYEWNQVINLADISSGQYILEVKGKTFKQTQQFTKN